MIFGISVVSLIGPSMLGVRTAGSLIIGCLIADTLISTTYYLLNGKRFDAAFTFIHHIVWAYLLCLYIDEVDTVRDIILGQIFIASVDLCANLIKTVDVHDPRINPCLHALNIVGRLLVGNYFIWRVWARTGNHLYAYAGLFNTCIGTYVMLNRNIIDIY